jgi:hypothetical protein
MMRGRWHHKLREDDGVAGSGLMVLQARGRWCHGLRDDMGSTVSQSRGWHGVDSIMGSGRTRTLQARGWHVVDSVTGSGMTPEGVMASPA